MKFAGYYRVRLEEIKRVCAASFDEYEYERAWS